ncbi:MAG: molybdenum cofactor guanylyltransferase [Methylococcales bacterium]|nr:molybdenum cofactor guanylyltransferase [Methylococcales bacterium]
MQHPNNVAGVILAGGQARRMNHQDKGLILFQGQPMVTYAIAALSPIARPIIISANRNLEHYQAFGWPVVADDTDNFDGPLAGVLAAMRYTTAELLLVMPCDSPLVKTEHLQKLVDVRAANNADVAVAFDGARQHPVFLAVKTSLQASLQAFLDSGQRKIGFWLAGQNTVQADFSDSPELFANVNTPTELQGLEAQASQN